MSTNIFGDLVLEDVEGGGTNVFGDPIVSSAAQPQQSQTSGPPMFPPGRPLPRLSTDIPPLIGGGSSVELLNRTAEPSAAEVDAIMSDPSWAAATPERPNVLRDFMHPENPLNVFNYPTFFLRGAEHYGAKAGNIPFYAARAAGLIEPSEEVFGATPQTRAVRPPFQEGVSILKIIPELERQNYSPVTRGVVGSVESLGTPGNLLMTPLGANKIIQALYLSRMVPDTYESFLETIAPGKTTEERIESGVHTGVGFGLSTTLGRHMMKQKPGIGKGVRPDAFEESYEALTPGEKSDIRGRISYRGETPILGRERIPEAGPVPTFYEVPRLKELAQAYQSVGEAKTGGEISFRGAAGAEGLPQAGGQLAPPKRPLRTVSEQERLMEGSFVPATEAGRKGPAFPVASPSDIVKATGFNYEPAMEQMVPKAWHFTDLRPDSPTRGLSVAVAKGSSVANVQKAIATKIEQGYTPPEVGGVEKGETYASTIREDTGPVQGDEAQKRTEQRSAEVLGRGGKEVGGYDVQQPAGREGEPGGATLPQQGQEVTLYRGQPSWATGLTSEKREGVTWFSPTKALAESFGSVRPYKTSAKIYDSAKSLDRTEVNNFIFDLARRKNLGVAWETDTTKLPASSLKAMIESGDWLLYEHPEVVKELRRRGYEGMKTVSGGKPQVGLFEGTKFEEVDEPPRQGGLKGLAKNVRNVGEEPFGGEASSMVGRDKSSSLGQAVQKAEGELGGHKGIGKAVRNVPSGSEEGAFSLDPLRRTAKAAVAAGKKVGEIPLMGLRAYAEPMVERLGRVGGPVAKKVTEEAHSILKQGKKWYGTIAPQVDKAKAAFGGGTPFEPGQYGLTSGLTTEGIEPTTWVRSLNEVTDGAAFNNFYGVNEGAVKTLPSARSLIATGDAANKAVGDLAARANPDFRPTGKLQRILNNFGYDIIRRGGGEAWDNWVKGIAEVNKGDPNFMKAVKASGKTPEQYIGSFFHRWKKELDAPGADVTTLDRIAQDFHRTMPRTITHVKALGAWHEVLVADPFNYFESAAQRTAHAVAFREVYPLVRDPNTGKLGPSGYLQKTREAVMREVPTDVGGTEFDNLMRTLQGHPLDKFTSGATAPDTAIGMGYRMAREVALRPLKALMLTANAPVNLSEAVVGGPTIFLGFRNVARGMTRLAKDNTLYQQLEMQGLVNKAFYNFAHDPNSPARSATRRLSNATSAATFQQALNELQEAEAAVTAKVMADRVRNVIKVPLSAHEAGLLEQTIRAMGLTSERAAKAVKGKDNEALQIFESKAASWLTAGNQAVGEMSRLGVSRVFNELFWFHRYSQMVANQFRSVGGNLAQDVGKWAKAPTKENWRSVRYNAELVGRMIAGRGMQGAVTIGIMAAVTGGMSGLVAKKHEAEDAPLGFLTDSFVQGVGGPLSILRRLSQDTHDSASLEQHLVELSPPAGVAGDFYDAMWGVGRYEGRRPDERVRMFLDSKTPGWKAVRTGMAIAGLGDPADRELEAATKAFYRWRKEQPGYPKGTTEEIDLRTQVKRVREELRSGGEWQKELMKVTDMQYASDALRAGTLLEVAGKPLSAEQLTLLERRIGKRAIEKLRQHDAEVRELGRTVNEADRTGKAVSEIKQPTGELGRDYTTSSQRRDAVRALLAGETRKLLDSAKMETPSYEPDVRPGRPVRELRREEVAVFNEEFAKQLDIRLAPLVKDAAFQSLPLPVRRSRLEDRVATARSRAQNVIRARLQAQEQKGQPPR